MITDGNYEDVSVQQPVTELCRACSEERGALSVMACWHRLPAGVGFKGPCWPAFLLLCFDGPTGPAVLLSTQPHQPIDQLCCVPPVQIIANEVVNPDHINVRLTDVGGLDHIIQDLVRTAGAAWHAAAGTWGSALSG